MDDETREALDDWADKIAALEPEARKGILAGANRLAADRRLPKADRDFARAQADAIGRAVRRAMAGKREPKRGIR